MSVPVRPSLRRGACVAVAASFALGALAACGGSSDSTGSLAKGPSGKIVVLAASSPSQSSTALR